MVYYCDAVECTSHSSKAKKLHIYPFVTDVMWPKDLSVQKKWMALIQHKGTDKTGKNVDVNITRNSRICYCHFNKEKINTETPTQVLMMSTVPGINGGNLSEFLKFL